MFGKETVFTVAQSHRVLGDAVFFCPEKGRWLVATDFGSRIGSDLLDLNLMAWQADTGPPQADLRVPLETVTPPMLGKETA